MRALRRIPGFTLIELLVVVAILAILASFLLPALGRAGGCARSAACRSNQQQLALAWQLYTDDHDDRLLPNYTLGDTADWRTFHAASNSWVTGSALTDESTTGLQQGVLWNYTRGEGVYRCPSDRSSWRYGAHRAPRPHNLSLSIWMNGGWNGDFGKSLDPLICERSSELRTPASLFTFIDEDAATVTHGALWVRRDQNDFWWQIPGARDEGRGANLAFADGHVFFHPWQFPGRAWQQLDTPVRNSADRADLTWLVGLVPSD